MTIIVQRGEYFLAGVKKEETPGNKEWKGNV